jgi:ribose 5-phosphate isomerase B
MIIAIGADHRGFRTKELLKKSFITHQFIDVGAFDEARSDYPIFAHAVVQKIQQGHAERGIVLCGSGIGMAIVANRYKGIYAGVVWNEQVTWQSRAHDNSNVLALPCDCLDQFDPLKLTDIWLSTEFLGDRYARRIKMIDEY